MISYRKNLQQEVTQKYKQRTNEITFNLFDDVLILQNSGKQEFLILENQLLNLCIKFQLC